MKTNAAAKSLPLLLSLLVLLSGCTAAPPPARDGTAPNEVLTLTPVSEDKTLIVMRGQDGVDTPFIESVLEARFSDVDVVFVNNTPEALDFQRRDFADLYLTSHPYYFHNSPENTLIDLSAEDFLDNYYLSALNECQIDGKIYFLPGPSDITGIVYDKELFRENGWTLPNSLDEFIALCQTIDSTGIRAFQPSLYYSNGIKSFFTAFTYDAVYAGIDNYQWLQKYQTGQASMSGQMEPAFAIMQKLLDAGIWDAGDFDVLPLERTYMLYRDHTCAMTIETQKAVMYSREYGEGREHELGMMPFFSGNGPDSDYLLSSPNFYIAANKKLELKGNEKKLEKAMDILAFLSSPDGQNAIISGGAPMISPLKSAKPYDSAFLAGVTPTLEKGNLVPVPSFGPYTFTEVDSAFALGFRQFPTGGATAEDIAEACDAAMRRRLAQAAGEEKEVLGRAKEDFSVMELSEYLADIFRRKAGTQIGLCRANTRRSGCNTGLYQGDITWEEGGAPVQDSVCYYLDRGFSEADVDENGRRLMRMTMTGENILRSLNELYGASSAYPAAYTVASGLRIEFAPWAGEGNRIVHVTLEDGSPLVPGQTYTVAAWNGSVDPALVESVDYCYEDSFPDIFADAIRTDKVIAPFHDGRFVLNWELIEGE